MKKALIFAILFSSFAYTVSAWSAKFELASSACEFAGSFTQRKFISALDQPLESSGQFYHHCDFGIIWSTTEPVAETLVMRRNGQGLIRTEDGLKPLSSRQGKFLSKLLNGLMSGDQSVIAKQFAMTQVDDNRYQLVPKKRSLKRGVKSIEMVFQEGDTEPKTVLIKVLDRNSQLSEISSRQNVVFDHATVSKISAINNCSSSLSNSQKLCENLLTP